MPRNAAECPCSLANQGRDTFPIRVVLEARQPRIHRHKREVGGGSNGIRTRVHVRHALLSTTTSSYPRLVNTPDPGIEIRSGSRSSGSGNPCFRAASVARFKIKELRHSGRRITAGDGSSGRVSRLLPSRNPVRGVWHSVAHPSRRAAGRPASRLTVKRRNLPSHKVASLLSRIRTRVLATIASWPLDSSGSNA
jgi:hypothetical protein